MADVQDKKTEIEAVETEVLNQPDQPVKPEPVEEQIETQSAPENPIQAALDQINAVRAEHTKHMDAFEGRLQVIEHEREAEKTERRESINNKEKKDGEPKKEEPKRGGSFLRRYRIGKRRGHRK